MQILRRILSIEYQNKGLEPEGENVEEIVLNGKSYVEKNEYLLANTKDDMEYVIVRTYSAGVHAGYLKERSGKEVTLVDSRRIYYWDGAATLSQMAMDGVSKPENCKFTMPVLSITLTEAIEILPCTEKAQKCIQGVKVWKM